MERKLVNAKGLQIIIKSSKWPGEYLMTSTFADGGMHIMFIRDAETEIRMLKAEGYVESDSYNY